MKVITTIAAVIALTVSAPAVAAPISATIDTNDIDLGSVAGQKALSMRIDRVATELCAAEAVSQHPAMIRAERACVKATKQTVEKQIAARSGYRTAAQ
jgi:UrcA family protein